MADFPGYGPVWFLHNGPANILSFHNLKQNYHILYDPHQDKFRVATRLGNQPISSFNVSPQGLYYHAMPKQQGQALVTTVANARSGYSQADYERAVGARQLQVTLGRPNSRYLASLLDRQLIPNCPYTSSNIRAADDIFGPELGILKGKTTRQAPERVEDTPTPSPRYTSVRDRYRELTLSMDIMHVNGVPFLVTLSRHLHFGTINALPNLGAHTIIRLLRSVFGIYKQHGFTPVLLMANGAFEVLRDDLRNDGITLNTTSRAEHVGEIERYIQTIKEQMRGNYNVLPFKKIPRIMLIEMAKHAVFWLNALVYPRRVSATLSPRQIV
ncbi:hypothetical protein ACA910_015995 [Epithemia clementina (nom. ined.)]